MASDEGNIGDLTKDNDKDCRIQEFKSRKRNAKSSMTHLLNKLAVVITEKEPQQGEIKDLLARIDEQKDQTVSIMSSLETALREDGEVGTAEKVSDEADDLVEQVDRETSAARSVLASLAKKGSAASSIGADSLDVTEKERERKSRIRSSSSQRSTGKGN